MKNHLPVLQQCALFRGISEADLTAMLHCMNAAVKTYDRRQVVLPEGSPAHEIGIVLTGNVQIIQLDYYGNRSLLGTAGPGELFAEAFACAGIKAIPVDVIASETCSVLFIRSERIMRPCTSACHFHGQLISNLMHILASKNIRFHQKIEITSKRTTRDKLMAYLMQQAKQCGSKRFEIPFTRQELADFLQVDRSGLSVQISQLQNEGVLKSKRRLFELL